jgi:hypothetical protein
MSSPTSHSGTASATRYPTMVLSSISGSLLVFAPTMLMRFNSRDSESALNHPQEPCQTIL